RVWGGAGERPLICVVDDEQWLDRASVQALGFAARRLAADPVGLVFATQVPGQELAALPELVVEGLPEEDARTLLESALTGPVAASVRDLVVAEPRGNPLALLQVAAADPGGDPLRVWRAAGRLGISVQAWVAGAALAEFGARVRFRHPLARSATYRSAPVQQMQEVHAALAEATDQTVDPDRR